MKIFSFFHVDMWCSLCYPPVYGLFLVAFGLVRLSSVILFGSGWSGLVWTFVVTLGLVWSCVVPQLSSVHQLVEFVDGEPTKFSLVTTDHRLHLKAPSLDTKQVRESVHEPHLCAKNVLLLCFCPPHYQLCKRAVLEENAMYNIIAGVLINLLALHFIVLQKCFF